MAQKKEQKLFQEKRSTHLVTKPVSLISIFLKRDAEKKDGSLQTSLVTNLNSDIPKKQVKQNFQNWLLQLLMASEKETSSGKEK